jgi:hypothetical protein
VRFDNYLLHRLRRSGEESTTDHDALGASAFMAAIPQAKVTIPNRQNITRSFPSFAASHSFRRVGTLGETSQGEARKRSEADQLKAGPKINRRYRDLLRQ